MPSYTCVFGGSELLSRRGTVCFCRVEIMSPDAYKVQKMVKTEYDRLLGLRDYHRYARRAVSKGAISLWMPEVRGLVVVEPLETPDGKNLPERLAGVGQAFAYFSAGVLGPGLFNLCSNESGQSESLLLEVLVPEQLRKNILADLIFGNHYLNMQSACSHVFWGLPEQNPKEIYAGSRFYVHPAGLKHDKRWRSIPYLKVGQTIVLEAETNNIHDPNAVHLWTTEGVDIGYLPRAIASSVAFHLRRGSRYTGKVAAVLGEEHQVDHRVALLVEKTGE
ncbi:MAG: hypothetical protein C4589_01015 [Peptococcaceae bacterium]|nr:MAG: hypothetical protein C4589_01015 [Peptococcaceae bacterium]